MPKKVLIIAVFAILALALLMAELEKPQFAGSSLDSPASLRSEEAKARYLQGSGSTGVILIHGLGATAFETGKLAEYLNRRNISALQVVLAGHDGSIYELEKSTAQDWYAGVENAFEKLNTSRKFVVGISLGGLTALELAQKKELAGVVVISAPVYFKDKKVAYAPLLRYFRRFSHRSVEPEHKQFYYENFPAKSVAEMVDYIKKVRKILSGINEPVLIIQSRNDPRLMPGSAQYIYDMIGSAQKELMWLNSETHVPVIEYSNESEELKDERQRVMDKVFLFVSE